LDLVEQLRSHSANRYFSSRVGLFDECAAAVREDFCDREADILAAIEELFEAGVVARTNIGRTFNQVASDQRARNLIEIPVSVPSVPPHGSSNSWGSIRDTATDNNICALPKRLCDSCSSKIAPALL
jgi:hypothetical protein